MISTELAVLLHSPHLLVTGRPRCPATSADFQSSFIVQFVARGTIQTSVQTQDESNVAAEKMITENQ